MKQVSLSEIKNIEIIMGQSPSSSTYNTASNGIPFLQGKAEFGYISPVPKVWCSNPLKLAKKGDLLISVRAPVGDINIADQDYCIGRGLAAIRLNYDILKKYLYYYIGYHKDKLESVSTGSTFKAINKSNLSDFLVEFPTNDLQTIVSFFDAMQQVIAGKRELISKYRELKINTINRVFSYGLEKQQDENEDFGKYPKGWKVGRISDVANVITGGTPDRDNKEFWDGDIPWVTTGEINYKDITSTIEKITQEGLNNSAAKIIPSRSILLAMYGQGVTRGKVAMLRIEAATNQACAAIITNNRVISEFLYYYLSSRYMEIRNLAHGANQQNLNLQLVKSIPIVYPEKKSEQEKIVEILHALDEKINAVQNDKLLNEELFNSALNKYLCQNN